MLQNVKKPGPFFDSYCQPCELCVLGRLTAVKEQEKASVCKQIKYSLVRDALSLCDY